MESTQLKVSQQLGFVHRQYSFNCFQFDDQTVRDDDVHAVAAIQLDGFINNGQRYLAFKGESDPIFLDTELA